MNFFYASGGALVCDEPIEGVTQMLAQDEESYFPSFYGGFRYFIAESMSKEAARRLAHIFGGTLIDWNVPPQRQISGAPVDKKRSSTWKAMYGEHPWKVAA